MANHRKKKKKRNYVVSVNVCNFPSSYPRYVPSATNVLVFFLFFFLYICIFDLLFVFLFPTNRTEYPNPHNPCGHPRLRSLFSSRLPFFSLARASESRHRFPVILHKDYPPLVRTLYARKISGKNTRRLMEFEENS